MKHILLLTLACLFFVNLNAQCINGTKSYPIYKTGAELVAALDEEGKEIVRIEYDIIRTSKETIRQLSSDWEYTIVAFGDDGIEDIDLKVYVYDNLLEKWELVVKDEDADDVALVTLKPRTTANYKIEISAYSFYPGYNVGRYGLFIFHD